MNAPVPDAVKTATPTPPAALATRSAARTLADFVILTKPRVNILVVFTTMVGFLLAALQVDVLALIHTLVGTTLVASGAAAINNVLEREIDARMQRTRSRPLPDGRLATAEAACFAAAISIAGVVQLALGTNLLAAAVALITLASYAFVYTPLKRVTSLSTVVGAVPGALPPVIGWTAATGSFSIEAAVLFAIVFLWQMPHVLSVAWLYRDDYARGGIRVLPVVEPDGASTARQSVVYSAALVPVSLLPTLLGFAGPVFFGGALAAGLGMVASSADFARAKTASSARRLFLVSLFYLPLLWVLLLCDSTGR
ncbi:MAG TPA: heme o synthase [Vicinamibacterales bacterium]|nr:heme o synthase [Vicinamibacterales bacterium]